MTNKKVKEECMRKIIVALSTSICLTTACAKSSSEITPQYVSPMQYNSYSCRQIEEEMRVISDRVAELGGEVDKTAENDKMQTAVGIVLLWPVLFFLDGDTPQAAQYARLKGEFQALEKASIKKTCGIKIEKIEAKPEPKKEEKKVKDFSKQAQ
jgi:hypothetical protein